MGCVEYCMGSLVDLHPTHAAFTERRRPAPSRRNDSYAVVSQAEKAGRVGWLAGWWDGGSGWVTGQVGWRGWQGGLRGMDLRSNLKEFSGVNIVT